MAGGWTRDDAVSDQIADSIADAIRMARERLPRGESLTHCEECDEAIPEARRAAVPGVRLCVSCQAEHDRAAGHGVAGFNRRGSKDSQLR